MNIKKLLFASFLLSVSILTITLGVLYTLKEKQEDLYQSQLKRYSSYLLADELRQSSDDLTRMARTYVITQDDKYEKMYWDILSIRNGESPRPEDMNLIYWDLILNYGDKPRPDGSAISLHQLMVDNEFSILEFHMLKRALDNSDSLVETETIAMNAVKGLFDDGTGNYAIKGEPDIDMAIRIMHDNKYHEDKFDIMRPLNAFLDNLNQRTLEEVKRNKKEAAFFESLLIQCISITFISVLITTFLFYKGYKAL